jgi:hypothetical protein
MNRQINERLKTLIAAYKTLGGSFTGILSVDPTHLRDVRRHEAQSHSAEDDAAAPPVVNSITDHTPDLAQQGSDRIRRIRDAVEGALSDIILLGTEEQVRLAERAARDLVAGRHVYTDELVVSLRDFIRKALDLEPIPEDLKIPRQGPTRPSSSGGRSSMGGSDRTSARQGGSAAAGGAGIGAASIGVFSQDGNEGR